MKKFREFLHLARLPEMRIFWIFSLFFIPLFTVNFLYLPRVPALIAAGLLIALGAAMLFMSYWTGRLNYDAKIERNELKSITYGLEDALIAYDQNFTVFFFNPAAENLFGLKKEAVVGKAVQPQDAERPELRLLAQVVFPSLAPTLMPRSKAGVYPQIADLSFDDPALELRVTTAPIGDEKGGLLGFVKIVRNRTREISLIRAKNDFITVASHQLRTPISEIKWALETLTDEKELSEGGKELIRNTVSSAGNLLHIVESLLTITKVEEGRFGYNFQAVDYVALLSDLLSTAMPQAERAGLKLYFDRPKESLPQVTVDVEKITMAMTNLLDNAVRYNVPNGQIIVSVKKAEKGPFLETSVKDTGIGVPPTEVPKIFTKFFRATNALKFQTEGSGLGLYIAKNIVQSHGGQMWAESEANRGSTFHFTLPTDPTLVPAKEIALEY